MSNAIKSEDQHNTFTQYRHKWEMPLIWASCIVTLLSIGFGSWFFSLSESEITSTFGEEYEYISGFATLSVSVLMLPVVIYCYRFFMAAKAKSNAIRVSPTQFPKLWELYTAIGEKMQMSRLPNLYVTNGNGVVNAYALSCNKRYKYVVLHSEVVLDLETKPEIVEFIIAHELAHHKINHVSLWRIIIGVVPNALIPLGLSTTRAQEYSADRVAMSVCGHHKNAMSLLAAGPWMEKHVDHDSWLAQCEQEHSEAYVRLANIFSDHPVLVKRFKALKDIEEKGFDTHGDMF